MTSVMPTVTRGAVTLLAIGGIAGQVAYLDARWWHRLGLTDFLPQVSSGLGFVLTGHALVTLVSALLAVVVVLYEGEQEEAAKGLAIALGAWAYLLAYPGVTTLLRPDPGLARDVFEGHFLAIEMLGLVGLLRFTAQYPSPLVDADPSPPDTLPPGFGPLYAATVWMLRPAAPWMVGGSVLVVLWGIELAGGGSLADAGLSPVTHVVRFIATALVVLNIRRAWGLANEAARRSMLWLLAGLAFLAGSVAVVIAGTVLIRVADFRQPPVAWHPVVLDLGLIGLLGCLTAAVAYTGTTRAIDVARRVATISSMLAVGLFLAAALEALLSGGVLVTVSVRGGVGTALALATMVSTYRGWARFVGRLLPET